MANPSDHKFIFLCGLHRSGTTPLFRILSKHPQISGFANTGVPEDEGQHLQNVYPAARAFGGPGYFGFAPAAHLTEHSDLCTPQNAGTLFQQWSEHWDLRAPYLLEKSPPNLIRTRFLQACFPKSYFIVIMRHPIAVSLATLKFSRARLGSLMEHWAVCHGIFESDRAHLKKQLIIRYEDLIAAPHLILDRIRMFLGAARLEGDLDRDGNRRYFTAWQKFQSTKVGRVISHDLVEKYEPAFREYGYSLLDPSLVLPSSRRDSCVIEDLRMGHPPLSA